MTDGDIAVDKMLKSQIKILTPDIAIISEETVDLSIKNKNKDFWLIDPIDGTRDYINKKEEYSEVDESCKTTMIKHSGLEKEVQYLSGGNQQKVLFARAAMNKPKLLIADEPTRGVDIGAKQVIYELISQLSKVGEAVLLISSEVEEIIGVAHRTLVMSRGKVVAELKGDQITKSAIMEAAFNQD